MRKAFALTSLSTVIAATLLVLLFPPSLCAEADSCPMRDARGSGKALCIPGPTFDCCNGNNTPLPRGSDELGTRHLPPAVMVGPSLNPVPPARRIRVDLGRAAEAGSANADVPLYTLLATLLI